MVEQKKKSWFRRHWILTTILVIVIIAIISGVSNSGNSSSSSKSSGIQLTNGDSSETKTSGYTLDDCYSACDKYCLQAQTDVCQSSCGMIGKEGKAMDKTVSNIKNITSKLSC